MVDARTPKMPGSPRRTLAKEIEPAKLYLREWLKHRERRQADITKTLGWEPGRVSKIVSGKQPYTGSDIAALAAWLNASPHELLMLPRDAEALRGLRSYAQHIANMNAIPSALATDADIVAGFNSRSEGPVGTG